MIYIFDSCSIIAYVRGENGKSIVENILLDSNADVLMHAINVCEVYYDFVRSDGRTIANNIIEEIQRTGIKIREDLDSTLWKMAGDLKAEWKRISLADTIAVALARRMDATLVTSDHGEFDKLDDAGVCQFLFIR